MWGWNPNTEKRKIKRIARNEWLCSITNYGYYNYRVRTRKVRDGLIMSFPLNEVFELPEIDSFCVLAKSEERAVNILYEFVKDQSTEIYHACDAMTSERIRVEKEKKENAEKSREDILLDLMFRANPVKQQKRV